MAGLRGGLGQKGQSETALALSADGPHDSSRATTWQDRRLYRDEALTWYRDQHVEFFEFQVVRPPRLPLLGAVLVATGAILLALFVVPVPRTVQWSASATCTTRQGRDTMLLEFLVPASKAQQLRRVRSIVFVPTGVADAQRGSGAPLDDFARPPIHFSATQVGASTLLRIAATGCSLTNPRTNVPGVARLSLEPRALFGTAAR